MGKSLILVSDSAGEPVLINAANIIRVTECEEPSDAHKIEILVSEQIVYLGMPRYDWEVNRYYSPLTLEDFAAAYA